MNADAPAQAVCVHLRLSAVVCGSYRKSQKPLEPALLMEPIRESIERHLEKNIFSVDKYFFVL